VAAGELSALLGEGVIDIDKRFRRHRFRKVAREVIERATPEQKRIVDAYVAGVNAARESLSARPFEYWLLGLRPQPWQAEDCVLVAFAMYIDLNDSDGARELERARLHAALPQAVFDVLYPRGGEWDAPLDGVDVAHLRAALPGADVIDLREQSPPAVKPAGGEPEYPGSNNWAVAGSRAVDGGALIANDMHLGLRVPHIWYRARMIVKSDDAAQPRDPAIDLVGVTLPGLPLLVAGSNGRIAWGFTNVHGNFDDLVAIEVDPQSPTRYRNGDAYLEFAVRRERIDVRGGESIDVEYRDTIWGPLIDADLDGKPLALAWTAHRPEATNLNQLAFETAGSVQEALDIANTAGIPVQNFVVADAQGHIGWTPIGKIPKRAGFDGRLPECWGCGANVGWSGWLQPQDYPRVVDPANGQLWSANSRTLGGAQAELIGDEDMDRGARTKQIRDRLLALSKATPKDMLDTQLDDRAEFLARWRNALIALLDPAFTRGHPARDEARNLALRWSGRAGIDDAGYRIVRAFRVAVQEDVYESLIAAAHARFPDARFRPSARFEDSLWQIVTTQPVNLLNADRENWNAQLLFSLDRALVKLLAECDVAARKLSECTWGKRNTLKMEHPLAAALPLIGGMLRMPEVQLPGDNDMPRVQGVSFGSSQRFAVSPGREQQGYFHMPGGQSGHPLSPFFMAGHEAWVNGEPTPFLPGDTRHRLELAPR
jgi:penicillin amidase